MPEWPLVTMLPLPSCLRTCIFGLAILELQIPSQFLLMAPYIVSMLVLAGVVGRGQMPAANGQPYPTEQ